MGVLVITATCSDCDWERVVNTPGQARALFFAHKCKQGKED